MNHEPLPSTWVIEEARTFMRAAQILEQRATDDRDLNLFWPAVMNSALACELFLKSCLVEADPRHPRTEHDPEGHLRLAVRMPGNGHGLADLYNVISPELTNRLCEVSAGIAPGFPLEKWIKTASKLFVGTRYPYEANSVQSVDLEVLKLAPHLDCVLSEMTR